MITAELRPPARRGSVAEILETGVRTIVLIDGVFYGEPAISPREILAALDRGIRVYGAAGVGALRAAECLRDGMIGHGVVYRWFRDGAIDADDEVMLRHTSAEDGYRALSEPLVNLRWGLQGAVSRGLLAEAEAAALCDEAKATYYPDRSWDRLLRGPSAEQLGATRLAALEAYIRRERPDVKRQDALELLTQCTGERGHPPVAAKGAA